MNVGVEIKLMVTRCSRKVRGRNETGAVANIGQQGNSGGLVIAWLTCFY